MSEAASFREHRRQSSLDREAMAKIDEEKATPDKTRDKGNLFWRHMQALTVKRFLTFLREKKMLAFIVFAPAFIVSLGVLVSLADPNGEQPLMTYDASVYNPDLSDNPVLHTETCSLDGTCDAASLVLGLPETMDPVSTTALHVEELGRTLLDTRADHGSSSYASLSYRDVKTSTAEYDVTVHANYTGVHSAPITFNA
ncbi:unnamed protein product, partial [Chrysoparadoxa australica]